MSCKRIQKILWLYPDRRLSERQQAAVERHLEGCPACRQRLEGWPAIRGELGAQAHLTLSPDFDERVLRAAQARCAGQSSRERRWGMVGLVPAWAQAAAAQLAQITWSKFLLLVCAVTVLGVPAFREVARLHFGTTTVGRVDPSNGAEASWNWPLSFRLPSASPERIRQLAEAVGDDPKLWQAAAEVASGSDAIALYDRAIALAPKDVSLYVGQAIAALRAVKEPTPGKTGPRSMTFDSHFTNLIDAVFIKVQNRLMFACQLDPNNAFPDYLLASVYMGSEYPNPLREAGQKPCFETYRTEAMEALAKAYRRAGYPELESQYRALFGITRPELAKLRDLARRVTEMGRQAQTRGEHKRALECYEAVLKMGAHLCRSDSVLDLSVGFSIQAAALHGPSGKQPRTWQNLPTFQTYARKHGRADLAAWVEQEIRRNLLRQDHVLQTAEPLPAYSHLVRVGVGDLAASVAALGLAGLVLLWLLAALPWGNGPSPITHRPSPIDEEGLPWRWWRYLVLWAAMLLPSCGLIAGLGPQLVQGCLQRPGDLDWWAVVGLTLLLLLTFEVGVALRLLLARRRVRWTGAAAARTFAAAARPTCALLALLYLGTLAFTVQARHDATTALREVIQHEVPVLLENGER
jgi:hypothetical protein